MKSKEYFKIIKLILYIIFSIPFFLIYLHGIIYFNSLYLSPVPIFLFVLLQLIVIFSMVLCVRLICENILIYKSGNGDLKDEVRINFSLKYNLSISLPIFGLIIAFEALGIARISAQKDWLDAIKDNQVDLFYPDYFHNIKWEVYSPSLEITEHFFPILIIFILMGIIDSIPKIVEKN